MAEADLSKIIGIIMENPKLVEQIREMVARSESPEEEKSASPQSENNESSEDDIPVKATIPEERTYTQSRSSRRNELLRAMRPYVSEQRGRAIESMITIADILFAIKEK